jgi:hypothetical protein
MVYKPKTPLLLCSGQFGPGNFLKFGLDQGLILGGFNFL